LIPFAKPYFDEQDVNDALERIRAVLVSGWLTSGPSVKRFEEAFSQAVGTKQCVAVNSCTAALHATLLALGIGEGDEVVVPANTFVATANAAIYTGAKPVFADTDPDTFNVSYADVKKRLSRRTKAIVAVHLGGNPCDMDELKTIADERGIALLEDCAHAHGAFYQSKPCGTLGVAGAFSFYPTKVMTAGEGGMIVTNNEEVAKQCRLIRNQGRGGYGPLEIVTLGYNFRMPDILAELGLIQLRHLDEFVRKRNEVAAFYNKELQGIPWIKPQLVKKGNRSSYYAYILELNPEHIERDSFAERLLKEGIQTSVLYHPVHLQPLYKERFGHRPGELPNAELQGRATIALPMYNSITMEDARTVTEAVKRVARVS